VASALVNRQFPTFPGRRHPSILGL